MTDQTSQQSQPSMEDILASIRRIINDDETNDDGVKSPESVPTSEQSVGTFSIDEDEAALARAEYDAAMRGNDTVAGDSDAESESIFPQREGALWRRVAGHPLSDGEADPLLDDETLELTDAVGDGADYGELELNELLDSADTDTAADDARLLDDVAQTPTEATGPSALGIGAMTAAGVGAAGVASRGMMDRIADRLKPKTKRDDAEDDVLDLTRDVEANDSVEDVASAMAGDARPDADDLPEPIFERVDVPAQDETRPASDDEETSLDRSFETVAVTGLPDDYSESLPDRGGADDAHERALDERFYQTDDFEDQPPEITGDYASSLGGDLNRSRPEGAPTEDEMETVGGLVRDALRGRLPAVQSPEADGLVSGSAEDSAARSLASLARYDAHAPRRIYGGIKITEDDGSPTIEGMVQDTLRPMLRDWLNDNLPTLVESMVKQEVDRISARSRRFVKDDD